MSNREATGAGDLSQCEHEPIHQPGAIQPHGAVLAALADSLTVTHASANLASFLGRTTDAVLGRPLAEVIGETSCRELQGAMSCDNAPLVQVHSRPGPDGKALELRAHRSGRHVCIDIEPIRQTAEQHPPVILAQSMLETFRHTATRAGLCELAVVGLRAITGFDRVMAYRFHDDGHGEVIAEARAARLPPYLGLHYPASDVPPQARRLYLRQRVGAIADSAYRPVPLLADPGTANGGPLDLTHSALRSASPIHREYMHNMNTAASLTIALVQNADGGEQRLWGMLVCHHTTRRVAGPELRAVAGMIGQVVSLLLGSLGEAELYAQRFERQTTLRELVDRLAGDLPLPQTLAAAEPELLGLVDATGAIVRISGKLFCLGRTPPPLAAERALSLLHQAAGGTLLALDDLGLRHLELGDGMAEGSGALLLPLARDDDDAILWFRPEWSRTVAWGGNPDQHGSVDPVTGRLSPRRSFDIWKQTVRGRSVPWTEVDLALAAELHGAIAAAMAQRTKAELAKLRHYDPLTGLPNRSLLRERLSDAQRHPATTTALLFIDLDRFKAVNDTMGHAAGDALLVEVSRRLLGAAGPSHMVARLGGDEFVVLCRGLDPDAIVDLSERVRAAIEAPFEIDGRPCNISASIGIAPSNRAGDLDLVRAADTAMYAAKQGGGNRSVLFDASLSDRAARHVELEHEMRAALGAGDQFVLLYQPLFRIGAGTKFLVGFEAVVRWLHPRRGLLSPDQFVPTAERSRLILALGDWVLAAALRQAVVLRLAHPGVGLLMTVNVSTLQLQQSSFCSDLSGALEAEGLPPAALCLEVAGSTLNDVAATAALGAIRKLGVSVAIDDFGIARARLADLRRLPVDMVKLDRGFLENMDADTRCGPFLSAVIALAHATEMRVVFEGIETQTEADLALAAGTDIVQGFFFGLPLPEVDAELLVAEHRHLKPLVVS